MDYNRLMELSNIVKTKSGVVKCKRKKKQKQKLKNSFICGPLIDKLDVHQGGPSHIYKFLPLVLNKYAAGLTSLSIEVNPEFIRALGDNLFNHCSKLKLVVNLASTGKWSTEKPMPGDLIPIQSFPQVKELSLNGRVHVLHNLPQPSALEKLTVIHNMEDEQETDSLKHIVLNGLKTLSMEPYVPYFGWAPTDTPKDFSQAFTAVTGIGWDHCPCPSVERLELTVVPQYVFSVMPFIEAFKSTLTTLKLRFDNIPSAAKDQFLKSIKSQPSCLTRLKELILDDVKPSLAVPILEHTLQLEKLSLGWVASSSSCWDMKLTRPLPNLTHLTLKGPIDEYYDDCYDSEEDFKDHTKPACRNWMPAVGHFTDNTFVVPSVDDYSLDGYDFDEYGLDRYGFDSDWLSYGPNPHGPGFRGLYDSD